MRDNPDPGQPGNTRSTGPAPPVNTLRLRSNGPLTVSAPVFINGRDCGMQVTLCRCGGSAHKPICDGNHTRGGFVATGEPAPSKPMPAEPAGPGGRDGPLQVEPVPDGPLHVSGNLQIVSASGITLNRVTECWLCRCGRSANKPYCDGSHQALGHWT